MLARVSLNIAFSYRFKQQLACFSRSQRRYLYTDEFVGMFPDITDLVRLIRATSDPDWNFFAKSAHESRNARRCERDMIKYHWLAAFSQISEQTILSFYDIELAMRPAQLALNPVANSPQTRRFFAEQNRTTLPHLAQYCGLTNTGRTHNQHVLAQEIKRVESLD